MAFVNARKGTKTIRVSRKAYEQMFKDRGYVLEEEDKTEELPEETSEEVVEEEAGEVEIPVSEMNKIQLMEFAKKNDIDTSGARTTKEARTIIQRTIRKRNME